jgi:hypothetical protein
MKPSSAGFFLLDLPAAECRHAPRRQLTAARRSAKRQHSRPDWMTQTEAAPIRYVAELIGTSTDSERAIRWVIALMVLTCDPLAITLTAAASVWRSTTA